MNNINARTLELTAVTGETAPWTILCDFDGTISLRDVTDRLLTQFGMAGYIELEEAWDAGKIGSRECMGGQIKLLDASKAELDAALDTIELDPNFKAFIAQARILGMPVKIISDGLDYAIQHILKRNDLLYLPIYANHLIQVSERRWQLEFPYANKNCVKASGNCKCARVATYHHAGERVLFVGDGSSDFCASGKVDYVLAKSSLIHYCQKNNIPHFPITGFADVINFLNNEFLTQMIHNNSINR